MRHNILTQPSLTSKMIPLAVIMVIIPNVPALPMLWGNIESTQQHSWARLATSMLSLWDIPAVRKPRGGEDDIGRPSLQDLFTSQSGAFIKYDGDRVEEEGDQVDVKIIDSVNENTVLEKVVKLDDMKGEVNVIERIDEVVEEIEPVLDSLTMSKLRETLVWAGETMMETVGGLFDSLLGRLDTLTGYLMSSSRQEEPNIEEAFSPLTFISSVISSLLQGSLPQTEAPDTTWQESWTRNSRRRKRRSNPRFFFSSLPGSGGSGGGGMGGMVDAVDSMVGNVVDTVVQAVTHGFVNDMRQEATYYSYRNGA